MSDATESREIISAGRREAQLKHLSRIADEIRKEDKKVQEGLQYSLKHAVMAGQLLNQCKRQIGHGGWLEWFESSQFSFSERTAQRYMCIYTRWKEIAAKIGTDGNPTSLADLTFSDALTLLNRNPPQPRRISNKPSASVASKNSSATNQQSQCEEGAMEQVVIQTNMRSDFWRTPDILLERVQAVLKVIDLDPAADTERSVNAERHYTPDEDGLAVTSPWYGRVFLNPPVAPYLVDQFIIRLVQEFNAANVQQAIAIVPADTDQKWFRRLAKFPRVFVDRANTGDIPCMPDPLVAIYLGQDRTHFFDAFQSLGDAFIAAD